jgi:hypothetical protein
MDELQKEVHGLAQVIYQQAQQQQTSEQQAQPEQEKKEDRGNVVDAEYKEVDDKDKK